MWNVPYQNKLQWSVRKTKSGNAVPGCEGVRGEWMYAISAVALMIPGCWKNLLIWYNIITRIAIAVKLQFELSEQQVTSLEERRKKKVQQIVPSLGSENVHNDLNAFLFQYPTLSISHALSTWNGENIILCSCYWRVCS